MGYRLGVDLGTTFTAAVVQRPGAAPTVVSLGERAATMPSVLFLGPDGAVLVGEPAERRAVTDPDRVVRRFKRRIGDETPLLVGVGGDGLTAHAIAARMIALVADRVAEQEGGAPDAIAVTVPAGWGAHKKDLLTGSLVREGLLGVRLVSEPAAAALAYADTGRISAGTTVAVYDFGGGTFDAALLRAGADGAFTAVGSPCGLPNLGGIDFDDAVLAYVLGTAGPQTPGFEADDALQVTAMARLRRECVDAKEALSADTTATVPVLLGSAQTSVRLTRGEFEAMIAGAVEETCTSLEAALVSAGLTRNNLDRILLTGGSSRIPLVTQLLSARYPGVALERDIDPKLAVATGAVLALALELPKAAGRHAAPRPSTAGAELAGTAGLAAAGLSDLESDGAAAATTPVAAMAAVSARPQRPSLDLEGFAGDREPGTPPVLPQRRKTPTVLMVAASVILLGSVGLSQFGALEISDALRGGALQEAHADADSSDDSQLEVEAPRADTGRNADAKASSASSDSAGSSSTAESSDSSAGTSGGRTEGTADTGSAGSSGSGRSTAASESDTTSERSGTDSGTDSGKTTKARSSAERTAAKTGSKKGSGGAGASSPATQPAAGETAPTAQTTPAAVAPAAEAEDTSTDSGSIEFNSGEPGQPSTGP